MKSRIFASVCRVFLMLMVCVVSLTAAHAQFNMSITSPLTLKTQQYGPATLTLTPQADGWSGTIQIFCSNLPAYASCIYPNGQSFAVAPNTPTATTIYVNTSEIYKYQSKVRPSRMEGIALCSLFAPALCVLFMGGRRRKKTVGLMLFALALIPMAGLTGCTSIRPPSTPPGTYDITITGFSVYYTQTVTMTLVVTP